MEIAFIGGTAFVGRHMIEAALARGHGVTVFHRGNTNRGLFDGVAAVHEVFGDRNSPDDLRRLAGELAVRGVDRLIDTCAYLPRQVDLVRDHLGPRLDAYVFISSVSAYRPTDAATTDEDGPRFGRDDLDDPATETVTDQTYGPLKAMCEDLALAGWTERSIVVRPTYVIGPHDRTDRFTHWVRRIAERTPFLAAGPPDAPVQVIDGRDLAEFTVDLAERGPSGAYNGAGPASAITWQDLFEMVASAVGGDHHLARWVDAARLRAEGLDVERDMPMWTDVADHSTMRVSTTRSLAAGLPLRPMAETVADLRAWDAGRGLPTLRAGLDPARERAVIESVSRP